jgi:hypothetical protein
VQEQQRDDADDHVDGARAADQQQDLVDDRREDEDVQDGEPFRSCTWTAAASRSSMPLRSPDRVDHPRRPLGRARRRARESRAPLPRRMAATAKLPSSDRPREVERGPDERLAGAPITIGRPTLRSVGQLAEDPEIPGRRLAESQAGIDEDLIIRDADGRGALDVLRKKPTTEESRST